MKIIMENFRAFLDEGKYGKRQNVLNKESYSEMIAFQEKSDLFVPLGADLMQRVFGDLKQEQVGFHITNLNGVYGLIDLQGTTKAISVMTRGMNSKFIRDGITNKGGIVVELEGRVVASGGKDLFSIPEKGGRRNIMLKMLRTMIPRETYLSLRDDILAALQEFKDADPKKYSSTDVLDYWYWRVKDARRSKDGAKLNKMIKFYLDNTEKIMVKYVDELRDAILTDLKGSDENYQTMGIYDENVMDKVRIKNVYLLDTYYSKRGMPGFPTEMELKQFISDMDAEGIDLYKAKAQEIIDTVVGKLGAK